MQRQRGEHGQTSLGPRHRRLGSGKRLTAEGLPRVRLWPAQTDSGKWEEWKGDLCTLLELRWS